MNSGISRSEDDYEAAWAEWEASGEQAAWDTVTSDALTEATRRDPGRPIVNRSVALRLHLHL